MDKGKSTLDMVLEGLGRNHREYHLNEDLVRFLTLRTEAVPEKIAFKPLLQE